MKAFISIDLEGMPYVVIPGHLNLKGSLYNEARKIASKITLIVADELHKSGFDEILIADSHGPMVNLYVEDLPKYVDIIRGFPRPTSMVAGVSSKVVGESSPAIGASFTDVTVIVTVAVAVPPLPSETV